MPHEIEADYNEIHLLPPALEDWVGPGHPARFIREFVEALDLKALGFEPLAVGEEGRPGYGPGLLLRVWLYGYLEKVRSHRRLENACRNQMGFIWLCGNHPPDHNTLWRFWRKNREALRAVFKQSVKVALEVDLVGLVLQAVDGTKIQAACGGRRGWDKAGLEKALERLDEVIEAQEGELLAHGAQESEELGQIEKRVAKDTLKAEKVRAALAKVQAGESRHVHPGDPQARRMECDGRNRFGYNGQAVVDAKSQVIVAAQAVPLPNDLAQLTPMLEQARENLGEHEAVSLADGGYRCGEQLQKAQEAGHEVLAPVHAAAANKENNPYHASCFEHDRERDIVRCPQGRELPLRRERERKAGILVREYRSAKVCADCPVRGQCTRDRHGRSIEIAPWDAAVRAHSEKMRREENIQKLKQRGAIVEPVFGWIKEQWGFRRWTVSGLENVRTQWAMVCTASNLRKIMAKWATQGPRSLIQNTSATLCPA